MKGYKVVAKFGSNTVKFELPLGVPQENLNEALKSARKMAEEAFGIQPPMNFPDTLKVTVEEYYSDD